MPIDVGRVTHLTDQMHRSEDDAGDPIDAGLLLAADGARGHTWTDPATIGMANPMTTPADIIVGGTAGAPARLAKGSDGQVLTVDPTTHLLVWATPSAGLTDPMTTRGDIIIRNAANATARLGRGSATQVLTSNGTDVAWAAAPGGGGGTASDGYTAAAGSGGANIPGLRGSRDAMPASPNAADQEFDAAHGGTQLGTLDVSNITDFPSHLHLKRACSSEIDGIYWAVPGAYPYTITTHIPLMAPSVAGHWSVGIMLLDSTPTAIREFSFNIASASGGTYFVSLRRYTNRTTFASAVDAALSVNDMYWGTARDIYLRLLVTSAASVTLSYSPNGAFWTTPASLTAISPTITPAYFGLLVSDPVSVSTVEAAYDWVRVT